MSARPELHRCFSLMGIGSRHRHARLSLGCLGAVVLVLGLLAGRGLAQEAGDSLSDQLVRMLVADLSEEVIV